MFYVGDDDRSCGLKFLSLSALDLPVKTSFAKAVKKTANKKSAVLPYKPRQASGRTPALP